MGVINLPRVEGARPSRYYQLHSSAIAMVTQRTEGLYRLLLLCQIVIVALLFWFGVWVMVTFYSPGAGAEFTWRRYSIYCGLIVIGMCLESLSRCGAKNYFRQNELLRQHRLSLRTNNRRCRSARPLPDRNQGRFYLARLLFQFCSMALRGVTFLTPLSAFVSGTRNLRRQTG